MMKEQLTTAITAALQAGKAILEIYHSGAFDVEIKEDNSPLTRADTASHNVIMSYLEATGIPVLSEEGRDIPYQERKDWKQLWICLLYTSPSPRDRQKSRMPSSA